jgi:hypothetical protein
MHTAYVSDAGGADASLTTALIQFAFFGAGRRAGLVDFTHPILAEYLAGLYAAAVLERAAHGDKSASPLSRVALMKGAMNEAFGDAPLKPTDVFARTVSRALTRQPDVGTFVTTAASTVPPRDVPAGAAVVVAML